VLGDVSTVAAEHEDGANGEHEHGADGELEVVVVPWWWSMCSGMQSQTS
jgi:hypothetical protein